MIGDIDLSGDSGGFSGRGNSQSVIAIGSGDDSLCSFCGREGKNFVAGSAELE